MCLLRHTPVNADGENKKGCVIEMGKLYEIVGFSVIWGSAIVALGIVLGNLVFEIKETIKERKKAKLAKKIGIKRYI